MKHASPYRRGLRADVARGFQGPSRGLMILVFVAVLVVFALSLLALVALLNADDTRSQIIFSTFFLATFVAMGMLKMGYYQRLDRLAILDALEEIRDRVKR